MSLMPSSRREPNAALTSGMVRASSTTNAVVSTGDTPRREAVDSGLDRVSLHLRTRRESTAVGGGLMDVLKYQNC
jgi:hypothetical protein